MCCIHICNNLSLHSAVIALEIHYDNPLGISGIVDESGFEIEIIPKSAVQAQQGKLIYISIHSRFLVLFIIMSPFLLGPV